MKVKLTLKLDENAIKKAKRYAKARNQSLSSLVENYFNILSGEDASPDFDISPDVLELSGIIKLKKNFNLKKAYWKYITDKHK